MKLIAGFFALFFKPLVAVLGDLLSKMATEHFLRWLLFWVADAIIKSNTNPKTQEFANKLRSLYDTDPLSSDQSTNNK